MSDNTDQFTFEVRAYGERIDGGSISDPFINTTVGMKRGIRSAWQVFWKGVKHEVRVDGTPAAIRVVFNSDYPAEDTRVAREGKG